MSFITFSSPRVTTQLLKAFLKFFERAFDLHSRVVWCFFPQDFDSYDKINSYI